METGVSYYTARDLRHVRRDLADIVEHHCTHVVHCVTETDLAFYREGMEQVARSTRDAGLDAWADPWGVAGIFSGETFSRFLLEHPESWQVRDDGRAVPVACPSDPEAKAFLFRWIEAVARLGFSTAFWDEPHFWAPFDYPDEGWTCRCACCKDAFRDRFRRTMPVDFDDEVRAFREETLLRLLADLCRAAHRAGLRNAICLLPSDLGANGFPEAERRWLDRLNLRRRRDGEPQLVELPASLRYFGVQDWDAAAALPNLDIFGCAPYWYLFGVDAEAFTTAFTTRALYAVRRAARRSGRPRGTQVWVQAFAVPAGRERELWTGVRKAATLGASHVAAWSYGGNAVMSVNRSQRPEAVWEVLGEVFRRVRG